MIARFDIIIFCHSQRNRVICHTVQYLFAQDGSDADHSRVHDADEATSARIVFATRGGWRGGQV